jgi:hypothetical protein
MTEQSYAVDAGHPPDLMLRLVNPVLSLLLRVPFAGSALKNFMVLSFTGRKTGRRFSIPLSAHVIDGHLYALTSAAWKHNFRGGAPAKVVYNGKSTAMRGELFRDTDVVSDLYLRAAKSYGVSRSQTLMGVKYRDQKIPTLKDFADAVDRMHLSAIRLSPEAAV